MSMNNPSPQPPQPTPARSGNGLGTAGFVIGLIGLIFAPIPVVGVIAWPLVIVGLVLSIIGIRRANNGAPNKGLSVAGTVCSAVGLTICVLWVAAFGEATKDTSGLGTDNPAPAVEATGPGAQARDDSSTATSPRQSQPSAGIGDPVRDGKFEFTVTKVDTGIQHVGGQHAGTDAQGQFVIVHVTVRNIGDESRMLDMSSQKLYDARDRVFEASSGAGAMALPDSDAFLNNINPGNKVRAQLLFDVPEDVELGSIELHDSALSGGVTVSL